MSSQSDPFLYYNDASGVLTIGGVKFRSFETSIYFPLNGLPIAKILVTPNDDVSGQDSYTNLYSVLKGLASLASVNITYNLTGNANLRQIARGSGFSDQGTDINIFNGIFYGFGSVRTAGAPRFVVWAVHDTLGVLQQTKAFIDGINGRYLGDPSLPAAYNKDFLIPSTLKYQDDASILADFWNMGIKPSLLYLVADNKGAADKLNAIEAPKLTFKTGSGIRAAQDARQFIMSPMSGGDMLTKLLSVCDRFGLAVVPKVSSTKIVPYLSFIGGIPKSNGKELVYYANDFPSGVDFSGSPVPDITAVRLYEDQDSLSFPFNETPKITKTTLEATLGSNGFTGYTLSPLWLEPGVELNTIASSTLGLSEAGLNAAGYKLLAKSNSENQPNSVYNKNTDGPGRYAKYLLACNQAITNRGTAKGPISFDIAPGSLVCINSGEAESDDANVTAATKLYASAIGVGVVFSSKSPRSTGSWVVLDKIRDQSSQDEATSNYSKHPLYDMRWVREPLIDAAYFDGKDSDYGA